MIELSSINTVVQKELLYSAVADVPGTGRFRDWKFTGFRSLPSGLNQVVGTVLAVSRDTNMHYHYQIAFDPARWLGREPLDVCDMLNVQIEAAVNFIVGSSVHNDGVLCENVFCERCYA